MALAVNSMAGNFIDMSNGGGVGLINFLVVPFSNRDYVDGYYISQIQIKKDITPVLFSQIKQVLTQQSQLIYPIGFEVNGFIVEASSDPYFDPNASSRKDFSYFTASSEINIDTENKNMSFVVRGISTIYGSNPNNVGTIYVSYDNSADTILVRMDD